MGKNFQQTSFLYGSNAVFIEELYQLYLNDPASVDENWQKFFENNKDILDLPLKTPCKIIIKDEALSSNQQIAAENLDPKNSLIAKFIITQYRKHGHFLAKLDPLKLEKAYTKSQLKLALEDFGFSNENLSTNINVNNEFDNIKTCKLSELISRLDKIYSGSIAAEFDHLENFDEQSWLFSQLENSSAESEFSTDLKKEILQILVETEGFEQYLHTKFPGAKRFSIEGLDASIIVLDKVIEFANEKGVQDVVIGMAHRGRLSTLTKILKKPYKALFSEFMGGSAFPNDLDIAGDVKYHMGYSSDVKTRSGQIHLSLTPNPSHLEAVNTIIAGKVRAKQDLIRDLDRKQVLGILVHGDAAFCGQGIVAEALVMSGLKPYNVGGIFHLITNNQVGFTANPWDSRPGRYATDFAKTVGAPILHVNGDDVEAVYKVTNIAISYRQKYGKDIIVDVIGYRKYGHNEGDEPMYTQAPMYNIIKNKQTPGAIYAEKLVKEGVIDKDEFIKRKQEFKERLDAEYVEAKSYKPHAQWLEGFWKSIKPSNTENIKTGIKKSLLKELGTKLCEIPSDFSINPKLIKLFKERVETLKNEENIDWATAEQLGFASLLVEKIPIRLTGQDVGRGTFSHRHSVLHSQVDYTIYEPLNNLSNDQAHYEVADSNLSEYGVLGFEYGYSLANPLHLVLWEAQFGDFANGAQIIFDQFIASAETKWLRLSGLVILLPHGMEGQGPEHSSARLERFLQLAAENNMFITYPTSPASIFHLLRRQIYSNSRRPLIVMSPKSLLRHKQATSHLNEFDEGTYFKTVIDEKENIKTQDIKRVIFCSGKIYYDLLEGRVIHKVSDVALIRLEQLYPYENLEIEKIINKYKNANEYIWCQEEPENMGAWRYIENKLNKSLEKAGINSVIKYLGRKEAASPAVGYLYVHNKEQDKLIKEALNIK